MSETKFANQEWLTEGARVYVHTMRNITIKTVDRVTATTVVVDGQRYSRKTLRRDVNQWESTTIAPLTNETVTSNYRKQIKAARASQVYNAAAAFNRTPGNETVEALEKAIAVWKEAPAS